MENDKKKYTQEELDILDRRNQMGYDILLNEIREVKEISSRNDRALRGNNGTAGLVSDVKAIRDSHQLCQETQANHAVMLRGDPKNNEDVGMVGEQKNIRTWIKEVKKAISSVRWWVFVTAAGFLIEIFLSHVRPLLIIK